MNTETRPDAKGKIMNASKNARFAEFIAGLTGLSRRTGVYLHVARQESWMAESRYLGVVDSFAERK
jgi:hypothetical protein